MSSFNYEKYWLITNGYDPTTGKKKEKQTPSNSNTTSREVLVSLDECVKN